jgi:hypothetical protein
VNPDTVKVPALKDSPTGFTAELRSSMTQLTRNLFGDGSCRGDCAVTIRAVAEHLAPGLYRDYRWRLLLR